MIQSKLMLPLMVFTSLSARSTPALSQKVRPICTGASRTCLVKTARLYIDGLARHDASRIPFAPNVRCTEQGQTPASDEAKLRSEIAGSTAIRGVRNVRLLADPQTQSVTAFYLLDVNAAVGSDKQGSSYTVRRAQRFKMAHGLITEVEIINYVDPTQTGGASALWAPP